MAHTKFQNIYKKAAVFGYTIGPVAQSGAGLVYQTFWTIGVLD